MQETKIGNVFVRVDREALTFRRKGTSKPQISLDISDVAELIEFLNIHAQALGDRRRAHRVPAMNSQLQVKLTIGHDEFNVVPLNVSLTGMFGEFLADEDPGMTTGDVVQVTLEYGDDYFSSLGIVRHRQGNGYGIQFKGIAKDDPPRSLSQIIRKLLQKQIADRLR